MLIGKRNKIERISLMEEIKMRKKALLKLLIIPLVLSISFLTQADTRYSKLYIFGDSLSDTGNLASIAGTFPAPFFNNRISNGPVAVDTLAEKLGLSADASLHLLGMNAGTNYAVASARASRNTPFDLNTQILSFQANHGFIAPGDALYVIFIGGNDIYDALVSGDITAANTVIQTAITNIENAIKGLSQMGARSFMVVNAPDIAFLPETQIIAAVTNNPAILTRATLLSENFNKQLHKVIEQLEDEADIDITEFKLNKLFTKLLKKAAKLGFSNSSDACFSTVTYTFHSDCNFGANFDQFFFFDEVHPTARIHKLVGEAMYKKVPHKGHQKHLD